MKWDQPVRHSISLQRPINADSVLRRHRKQIFDDLFTVGPTGIRHKNSPEPSDGHPEEPTSSLLLLEDELDEAAEKVSDVSSGVKLYPFSVRSRCL